MVDPLEPPAYPKYEPSDTVEFLHGWPRTGTHTFSTHSSDYWDGILGIGLGSLLVAWVTILMVICRLSGKPERCCRRGLMAIPPRRRYTRGFQFTVRCCGAFDWEIWSPCVIFFFSLLVATVGVSIGYLVAHTELREDVSNLADQISTIQGSLQSLADDSTKLIEVNQTVGKLIDQAGCPEIFKEDFVADLEKLSTCAAKYSQQANSIDLSKLRDAVSSLNSPYLGVYDAYAGIVCFITLLLGGLAFLAERSPTWRQSPKLRKGVAVAGVSGLLVMGVAKAATLAGGVAMADFCMDPAEVLMASAANEAAANTTRYYAVDCAQEHRTSESSSYSTIMNGWFSALVLNGTAKTLAKEAGVCTDTAALEQMVTVVSDGLGKMNTTSLEPYGGAFGNILELGTCDGVGVQYENLVPKAVCQDLVPGLLSLWAMEIALFSAGVTLLCLLPTIYEVSDPPAALL